MVLQALNQYYGVLSTQPDFPIARSGFAALNVSAALVLSESGELLEIIPLKDQMKRGNNTVEVPQRRILPEPVIRSSGVCPNFLYDNTAYVLGISERDADDPAYSRKRHQAFCEFNLPLLKRGNSKSALALTAFLESYQPTSAREHPAIKPQWEYLLLGGNLIFKVYGLQNFVHEEPELQQIWRAHLAQQTSQHVGQCLVTGEKAPIAVLHPKIKGIRDAQSTGAALVSFNERAYESYNRTNQQGMNSPVSGEAVFAYTTTLNYLLSRESHNPPIALGDATIVYWAESSDESLALTFNGLFAGNFDETDEAVKINPHWQKAEQRLREIAESLRQGKPIDSNGVMQDIDPTTKFYVLGLSPNAARVAVQFFYTQPFIYILKQISSHYRDMQIAKEFENQPDFVPIWQLQGELISRKAAKPSLSPLLGGALVKSILFNQPYPAAMFYTLLNRVRADNDDPKKRISKINYVRAGLIKAYLLRKTKKYDPFHIKEVLTMSLNETSTNPPYLLGRLFAVLEKAQLEAALPAKLNATIKDRYFTSACAAPATVFPQLIRLSQHHISKAKYGVRLEKSIGEIMELLSEKQKPFPSHLSLDEQGAFILGYYHQRVAFFAPKNEPESEIKD